VLFEGSRTAAPSDTAPVVLADPAVQNVNAQVDALIHTGVLRGLLAFRELSSRQKKLCVLEAHNRSPVAFYFDRIARKTQSATDE
jgi:hypothetical protein